MEKYTELLIKLEDYLQKPDVDLTDDVISACDLYHIVNSRLSDLRSIHNDKDYIKSLNSFSNLSTRKNVIQKIRKQGLIPIHSTKFTKVRFWIKPDRSEINFINKSSLFGEYDIKIRKNHDSDEIYFDGGLVDRDFVNRNYDMIDKIFSTLEDTYEIFGECYKIGNDTHEKTFSDGFLNIRLITDIQSGNSSIKINIVKSADPDNIYQTEWYNRERLSDFVARNQEELLKKVPIPRKDLTIPFAKMVDCYEKSNNDYHIVKTLVKKT